MQRPAAPQGTVFAGLTGTSSGTASRTTASPITITKSDYDAFERLLGDIQSAFSAEDLPALRGVLTPEMLSYFSEQLADNASRGLINRVEGSIDYATVAMKYALKDSTVERARDASSKAAKGLRSRSYGPSDAPAAAIGCSQLFNRLDAPRPSKKAGAGAVTDPKVLG
jgi:predicted lipid-binding transport protein (Tim44 family)